MPLYEYSCPSCRRESQVVDESVLEGGAMIFTLSRPMRASSTPAPCPKCSTLAPRILSASSINLSAVIQPSDIRLTPSPISQPLAHRRLQARHR